MEKMVKTSAIFGNVKIEYSYVKPEPLESLNVLGNFYRHSHLHKNTHKFIEDLIKGGSIPKKGEKVLFNKLGNDLRVDLTITEIFYDYQRTESEKLHKQLEDKFDELKSQED